MIFSTSYNRGTAESFAVTCNLNIFLIIDILICNKSEIATEFSAVGNTIMNQALSSILRSGISYESRDVTERGLSRCDVTEPGLSWCVRSSRVRVRVQSRSR